MAEPLDIKNERRLQLRTYNGWLLAAEGKEFPTLAAMEKVVEPATVESSFVLEVGESVLDPKFVSIGGELLEDVEEDSSAIGSLKDVPKLSLLSRLSEHYLECIANRVPVGIEASFVDAQGRTVLYRGIVLPLSTDGSTVDHVWGTINGKTATEPKPGKKARKPANENSDGEVSSLIEELSKERKDTIERVGSKLDDLMAIDGVSYVALVDRDSRACLAVAGELKGIDTQVLTAGYAKVMSEKQSTLSNLGMEDEVIEGMLFALSGQHHLLQPIGDSSGRGLFVLVVSDRAIDNLAMTRFKVAKFEKDISDEK